MTVFELFTVASWQVGDSPVIRFPITGQLQQSVGNRLVRHERAYRRGAKLDGTGAQPDEFQFTARFNNSIREPGLENNPEPLYPNMLRAFMATLGQQRTGTLVVPTVGAVRARIEKCVRQEDFAERDEATLQITAVEDNEDAIATAAFALPSARATVTKQAGQTVFSAEAAGAMANEDLFRLKPATIDIESLLLAPGRVLADLESQVKMQRFAVQRMRRAQAEFARDVVSLGGAGGGSDGGTNEPRGSAFFRSLLRLEDTLARSSDEKFASRPRIRSFVVDVPITSLFEIAARLKQDAAALLELNGERVADPFGLEQGEVIRVFETGSP
jgi:hypothetical protein